MMTTTVQSYKQQLNNISGSMLNKVKTLITQNIEQWYLEDETTAIDLLDDKSITAQEIVDVLTDMVACEDGNASFKNAVLAMILMIEKTTLNRTNLIVAEELLSDNEEETDNVFIFNRNNTYPGFALSA